MPEPGKIRALNTGSELTACPACGYRLGFHTSFLNISTGNDPVVPIRSTLEVYRIILVCPDCGARYDVGWKTPLSE
jgi:DNA-directed RNA polymerase subunit RPC12/RpoP